MCQSRQARSGISLGMSYRHERTVKIRFTTFSARRMAPTSVYGPKYRAPSDWNRRVTNTRGYGSCSVTLMYGYDLSSRSAMLNRDLYSLIRLFSRISACASDGTTMVSMSRIRRTICRVLTLVS